MTLRIPLITLLVCITIVLQAQDGYFQQQVNYKIDAALDTKQKAIHGNLTLDYTNNSNDTLQFIWFHIWPNAYSGENTALAKQLENDKELRKTIKKSSKGFIDSLAFTSNGKKLKTQPHPVHPDIMKVMLNEPLLPGHTISTNTPFYNKLPTYFSRSGESEGQFIATQWYPKPAVYDKEGWHEMPYLDMGEYYADFGNFDVSLTVPANMLVAASGTLLNEEELALYKKAGLENQRNEEKKMAFVTLPANGSKTLKFRAENVHDFAWFAQPGYLVQYDTCRLPSGKTIDVFSYYRTESRSHWIKSLEYLKAGIRFYSNALGEYPHPQVTAVQGPKNVNSGGMEYPMITLITVPQKEIENQLEATIVHEVGHNWFQGILGTDERKYPWFDEGFNSFYQFQYEAQQGKNSIIGNKIPQHVKSMPPNEFFNIIMQALSAYPFTYAVNTPSEDFDNKQNYGVTAYLKAAIWMYILQSRMGVDDFEKGMKLYFDTWRFRHPSPADFQESMEKAAGFSLEDIFSLLDKQGKFITDK